MTLDKRYTSTLWSLLVIAIWTGFVFLIAYPSQNAPIDDFGVVIYCILTLFFGLATGAFVLIIRFLKFRKGISNFYYNFVGTLNVCLGILCLTLASLNEMDRPWVILFAISFIIGLFILIDIYAKKR
jgi:hypothetical protein